MSATQFGGRFCLPRVQPKQANERALGSARQPKKVGHGARAVLDKFREVRSNESSTRGADRGPTSVVLEELFTTSLQMFPQEVEGASIADVDVEGTDVEDELTKVFQALRLKEEELAQQEQDLVRSQQVLEDTKQELSDRAVALAEAVLAQVAREKEAEDVKAQIEREAYEMEGVRRKLESRLVDLAQSKKELEEKAQHLKWAQDALFQKMERVRHAEEGIKAMDCEVAAAAKELEAGRRAWREALDARKEGEEETRLMKREMFAKEHQLVAATKELQKKERMLRNMQSELLFLQEQSAQESGRSALVGSDLSGVRKLLRDVQAELQASHRVVARSQSELSRMHGEVARKERQLSESGAVLQRREGQLGLAAKDLGNVRAALKDERGRCDELQREVEAEVQRGKPLLDELAELRAVFRATVQEVVDLKLEVREKERALSDAKLALQMKEAEVAATKVELEEMKQDLSLAEREVSMKGQSILEAQKLIAGLRKELVMVKAEVQMQEERAQAMQQEMSRKEGAIGSLKTDLISSQAKLTDTESVMRQIADLSKELAVAAGAREGLIPRDTEDAQYHAALADSTQELFATNRRLLERGYQLSELEELTGTDNHAIQELGEQLTAVKAQLVEREAELQEILLELVEKEKAMKGIESSWHAGGAQLARLRDRVLGGAHELQVWKQRVDELAEKGGLGLAADAEGREGRVQEAGVAADELEIQVLREEVKTVMSALKDLVVLSSRLREEAIESPDLNLDAELHEEAQALGLNRGPWLFAHEGASALGLSSASDSSSGLYPVSGDVALVPPQREIRVPALGATAAFDRGIVQLTELQGELESRDATLLLASQAMMGLSKLTQRLASEAVPEK